MRQEKFVKDGQRINSSIYAKNNGITDILSTPVNVKRMKKSKQMPIIARDSP